MPGVSKPQRNREAPTAKAITQRAYANPNTRCWRCHHTLATCGPRGNGTNRNGTPASWDAGHGPDQVLRPECSPCNRSDGATQGNRTRSTGYTWP